jgi:3-phosphoshikimate 1-carboxyvinyltransferase
MIKQVKPSTINGTIPAPASKSMMQRAIAIATLAKGQSVLYNYTPCNDSDTALEISASLGATVSIEGTTVTIDGGMNPNVNEFSCGEAGLGIRMFTPIASLWNKKITLHGEGSLQRRPISMLEQPLRQLGVDIKSNNGFVPITVKGPLLGKYADVDGSISSQMLTGMLIALPLAANDTILNVKDLTSKPYIDMTLDIVKDFGVNISHDNYKTFTIKGNQSYIACEYNVEGDWSGASFLLVAGALGGEVTVSNIRSNSLQADLQILEAIKRAGAIIECTDTNILVKKNKLLAFEFDATECPDLFPPLVSLACHCEGVSTFKGVSRLKHKESDRASVLKTEFAKIGTKIELDGDTMYVYGKTVTGGTMHANNDHRIAMAAAVAAILAKKTIEIENAECIAKSYPGFYEDFAKIGGNIK